MLKTGFALLAGAVALVFCTVTKQNTKAHVTGPQAIVYKTKADYSRNVPVSLSEDKARIVSYPALQDVFTNGKLAYPTTLVKGYLLDNRGIGPNSAFLKITYEEYSKLQQAPSVGELYKMIIDKEPFTEMYDLGPRARFKDPVAEINLLIKRHKLKEFEKPK